MSQKLIVRKMEEAQAPLVAELYLKTYAESFDVDFNKDSEEGIEELKQKTAAFVESCRKSDHLMLSAHVGLELVGFIRATPYHKKLINKGGASEQTKEGAYILEEIYIWPPYQNKGYGQKLIQAALESKILKNCADIYLEVWAENKRACHVYKTIGFEVVGECAVVIQGEPVANDLVMRLIK